LVLGTDFAAGEKKKGRKEKCKSPKACFEWQSLQLIAILNLLHFFYFHTARLPWLNPGMLVAGSQKITASNEPRWVTLLSV
jgi:hypothetical protein